MTDQEINIKIAEACGMTVRFDGSWFRNSNQGCEDGSVVPSYCSDLNAMHEAERAKGLHTTELSIIYKTWLDRLSCPHFATARQRAEAFLRTLNLWT